MKGLVYMANISKADKTWRYRVSYYDDAGKRKWITKSGFRTKAEATAVAVKVEADFIQRL